MKFRKPKLLPDDSNDYTRFSYNFYSALWKGHTKKAESLLKDRIPLMKDFEKQYIMRLGITTDGDKTLSQALKRSDAEKLYDYIINSDDNSDSLVTACLSLQIDYSSEEKFKAIKKIFNKIKRFLVKHGWKIGVSETINGHQRDEYFSFWVKERGTIESFDKYQNNL